MEAPYAPPAHKNRRIGLIIFGITLAVLVVFTISNVITFARVNLMELYRRMGYPEHQLELFERVNIFTPGRIVAANVVCALAIIGYFLFIKKYFGRGTANQPSVV